MFQLPTVCFAPTVAENGGFVLPWRGVDVPSIVSGVVFMPHRRGMNTVLAAVADQWESRIFR